MNVRRRVLSIIASIVMLAGMLAIFSQSVGAASNGALDVTVSNSPQNVKVELFQVGAPYPSRQDFRPGVNWYNLVTTQRYFVRVTNTSTGQQRQSYSFCLASDGRMGAIAMDWLSPNFVRYVHDLY